MDHPVVAALAPVVLLIAVGWVSGRRGWIGPNAVKDLSNLVFVVLTPALLFRTMSTVHVGQLQWRAVASYFLAVAVIFFATLGLRGFTRRGAVIALAVTFSNTVMIGIPLIGLAFGDAGLVTLFTLISMHSLVMLTAATIVLELAVLREAGSFRRMPESSVFGDSEGRPLDADLRPHDGSEHTKCQQAPRPVLHTVLLAMRNTIVHPVPLPIIAGLLFAATGWTLPPVIDKPLQLLGNAFGPLALLLVGATLASTHIGAQWRGALALAIGKNIVHPLLVLAIGWLLGLDRTALAVMVAAAALPIGANVFLFSQRYEQAQDLVTAAVALSTLIAIGSVSAVLAWVK